MTTFKDCGLKFRYGIIDGLPEEPSPAATKGSLVHRALEVFFWLPGPQRTEAALLDCLHRAKQEFEPQVEELQLPEKDRAKFMNEATRLTQNYLLLEDPTTIEPVGIEVLVELQLGSLRLRGIIDRLDRVGDGVRVVDWKTGRAPSQNWEQGKLGGVHFYAYACEQILGVLPQSIELFYLAGPTIVSAQPSPQSTRGVGKKAVAIWSAIEKACEREDFRPRPSRLCSYCSYKSICPAFN